MNDDPQLALFCDFENIALGVRDSGYKDFDIDEEFRDEWDHYNLWRYESHVKESTMRAYSMANFPLEKGLIKLNIRIATPPPGDDKIPPGIMSSPAWSMSVLTPCGHRHVTLMPRSP